jgi:hypothetical protein
MSTSTQQVPPLTYSIERRFYPRIVPQAPIFVAFRESSLEESLLLNVSENGLLLSTPTDLACNFVARLCLRLHGLPRPVQVTARVVWASETNKLAGVQLLDLHEYDRQQLRRWGARESAQSLQTEPDQPLLVVPPSQAPTEAPRAPFSFAEVVPISTAYDVVPIAPPQIARQRSTSIVERCVIWGLYIAAASLVVVFFLKNEVLGNLLLHSRTDNSQTSAASLVAQKSPLALPSPGILKLGAVSLAATPRPAVSATKSKSPVAATPAPRTAAQIEQATANNVTSAPVMAGEQNQLEDSPTVSASPSQPKSETDQSQTTAPLSTTEAESEHITVAHDNSSTVVASPGGTLAIAPDPPAPSLPPPNPTRTYDAPPSTSAALPSNPMAAPTRVAIALQPTPTVTQMDPPRSQVFEVRLPGARQASFLPLPGERVLETPSVTMRIQRSVLMPASGGGWFASRNKKVVVGELIARVDPQAAQIPAVSANSVRVKATIAADGHLENVKLILGPPSLVPAVAKALYEWRYQPTLVDGKPVETQCSVVFQFHTPTYRSAKR